MATQLQGALVKSTIDVGNIRKSVVSFNKSIASAQKTTVKINESISQTNRQKQRSISIVSTNFQKRREAVRRREREDIVEASSVGGAIKRQGKVITSSTKGFLGRIMDFVGTLMVGWLLNNLPTIIRLGEQLIERGGKLLGVLRSFIGNVTSILSGFSSLLVGTLSNLIGFDFSDQKQLIDSTLSTIQYGMIGIENDINSAIGLLTKPLDLGFGELDFDEGGPPPGAPENVPSAPSGGGEKFKPLLDLISSGESPGGGYSAMYPSESYPQILNMSIAEVIQFQKQKKRDGRISAAIGRYQMLYPENYAKAAGLPLTAKFSPENQDKMAIAYLKKNRRLSEWEQGKISDEAFSEELAREFGAFRSASGYVLPGNTGSIGFNKLKPVLQKIKSTPAQVTPTPSTPLPRSRVKDEINVSGPSGGTPSVGLSGGGGNYGSYRSPTRTHAGIDIGTSGQKGWLVGFKASGTVTYAGQGGGYGNLVIIKSGNTEYYFAHLARIFVKLGSYNGEVIGEIGNTGSGSGIHLHYEVRPNGNPINPKPYLNLLDIGRTTVAAQTAAKPANATGIQIASANPPSTQTATQVTPERKGQTILVPMQEPTQVAQAPAPSSRGGSGLSGSSSDTSGLNRYIEQRQYLQLA